MDPLTSGSCAQRKSVCKRLLPQRTLTLNLRRWEALQSLASESWHRCHSVLARGILTESTACPVQPATSSVASSNAAAAKRVAAGRMALRQAAQGTSSEQEGKWLTFKFQSSGACARQASASKGQLAPIAVLDTWPRISGRMTHDQGRRSNVSQGPPCEKRERSLQVDLSVDLFREATSGFFRLPKFVSHPFRSVFETTGQAMLPGVHSPDGLPLASQPG